MIYVKRLIGVMIIGIVVLGLSYLVGSYFLTVIPDSALPILIGLGVLMGVLVTWQLATYLVDGESK